MANYRTEWQAIYDRIEGLMQAGQVFITLCGRHSEDPYGTVKAILLPHARKIITEIDEYCARHLNDLPVDAVQAFCAFKVRNQRYVEDYDREHILGDGTHLLKRFLPSLASIRAEVNYLLSDTQAVVMRMTERSFTHLQRLILVDDTERVKWQEAFRKGEVTCEKRGAVHLLLHGIWGFKVDAKGERTDLVLGEPLRDMNRVASAAEALVLTEWKKVAVADELAKQAKQAYIQAKRYGRSTLAGFELADYRYLVLVSEKDLHETLPDNIVDDDGITYRYINISVDPENPSELRSVRSGA